MKTKIKMLKNQIHWKVEPTLAKLKKDTRDLKIQKIMLQYIQLITRSFKFIFFGMQAPWSSSRTIDERAKSNVCKSEIITNEKS